MLSIHYTYEEGSTHLEKRKRDYNIQQDKTISFKRLGVVDNNVTPHNDTFVDAFKLEIKKDSKDNAEKEYKSWKENKSHFCLYIKLHGSMYFVDEQKRPILITGTKKEPEILSHKLILYYNKIFKEVAQLVKEKFRLFIIGYGFCDKHINDKIVDLLKKKHCELYIIDKNENSMKCFFEKLKEDNIKETLDIDKLKEHLKGYWSKGIDLKCLGELNEIISEA